jgi:hypothetical protein
VKADRIVEWFRQRGQGLGHPVILGNLNRASLGPPGRQAAS